MAKKVIKKVEDKVVDRIEKIEVPVEFSSKPQAPLYVHKVTLKIGEVFHTGLYGYSRVIIHNKDIAKIKVNGEILKSGEMKQIDKDVRITATYCANIEVEYYK